MAGYRDSIEQDERTRRKPATPKGYGSSVEFLLEMRKRYSRGRSIDEHNERAGRDDARFVIGHGQWDEEVERRRRAKHKPVLTFDRLQAFIAQVVNNRLMNETEIRVFPDKAGTKEVAQLREGIIRSIYKNSYADFARDEAQKYQVIGGQGGFCLGIDYVSDDVFEQEIRIKHIADPYSFVLDDMSVEPTGGDAEWGFVDEDIPAETYRKRYPWAGTNSFNNSFQESSKIPWFTQDSVRIVTYWRRVTEGTKVLALYTDGTTHDVTDMEPFEYMMFVATRPDGSPYVREVPNRFFQMYLCSGNEILEGPYNYPLSSIPIYRVPGWEVTDGEKLYRWGLTRKMKDPLRLHNYARSVQAEQLVATPRNKYLTTQAAVKGYENRWRNAASSDDPFLFYQDGEAAPVHVPPPPLDPNLIAAAEQTMQDLRDISNIHEAALGMPSNEVSKVAIQQRQSVSDVGTFIYQDRLRMADERCAKNINELIPYVYDTQRLVTIYGEDNKPVMEMINDPMNPNSDVTLGKYGVTVTVGPSTVTKRQLAAEQMTSFMNAIGPAAEKYLDLLVDAQDWPQTGEWKRRAQLSLPDGFVPEDELTPEQKQARQMNQQLQEMAAQLEKAQTEADIAKKQADASLAEARAEQAKASAYKAISDARARMMDVQGNLESDQFEQAMKLVDQHNQLEAEDRDFESRKTESSEQ